MKTSRLLKITAVSTLALVGLGQSALATPVQTYMSKPTANQEYTKIDCGIAIADGPHSETVSVELDLASSSDSEKVGVLSNTHYSLGLRHLSGLEYLTMELTNTQNSKTKSLSYAIVKDAQSKVVPVLVGTQLQTGAEVSAISCFTMP